MMYDEFATLTEEQLQALKDMKLPTKDICWQYSVMLRRNWVYDYIKDREGKPGY